MTPSIWSGIKVSDNLERAALGLQVLAVLVAIVSLEFFAALVLAVPALALARLARLRHLAEQRGMDGRDTPRLVGDGHPPEGTPAPFGTEGDEPPPPPSELGGWRSSATPKRRDG